ncbi:uncharacterized protein LOC132171426 [Corylus avellana]|uniref:uncharacterized protein LOC132171426 n=1 Tax=Corylus avellana TaxID=13451 RepID=UPI00286D54D6|nr:uncharacterized protein LOC132171426 [Corylus avellana]
MDNQVVEQEEDTTGQEGEECGNKEKRYADPSIATPIIEDPPRSFMPKAPYPKRLQALKRGRKFEHILEVFKQVQINIPFLDAIQQVPSYAKFFKDLITVKRKTNVPRKAFLTEQLGLGELKPTAMTLQLANRSVKVPQGIVEDVLIKVDKFYFPVDFIVLDTELVHNVGSQILVCLIEEIIEEVIEKSSIEDPLEACFAQFGEDLDLDKLLEHTGVILETTPLVSSEKEETIVPDPPKKELKPLPDTLNYKFPGPADSLPVIIASDLVDAQKEKLLEVLRKHKEAIS